MSDTPSPLAPRALDARLTAALAIVVLVFVSAPLLQGCYGTACGPSVAVRRPPRGEAESYDASTDRWRSVRPLPEPVAGARAVEVGGMIYVIGGGDTFFGWDTFAHLFRYDPTGNTWTQLADMPTARSGHGAAAVGTEIYVVGGVTAGLTPHVEVEVFDTALDAWRVEPDAPNPHARFDAVSIGGVVYAPGGDTDRLDALDTTTGSWSPLAPLPLPLSDFAVVTDGGRIFVIGGHDPGVTRETPSDDLWIYEVATDTWSAGPSAPELGNYHAATIDGARVYVFGAFWPAGNEFWGAGKDRKRVLALNTSTLIWATSTPKRENRYDVATAVADGIVYVFGGWGKQRIRTGCR